MKIVNELFHLQGHFMNEYVLFRTVSSYKLSKINEITNRLNPLGYKVFREVKRRRFLYTIQYIRYVPPYQILFNDDKMEMLYKDEDLQMQKDWKKWDWQFFIEKQLFPESTSLKNVPYIDTDKVHKVPKHGLTWWIDKSHNKDIKLKK